MAVSASICLAYFARISQVRSNPKVHLREMSTVAGVEYFTGKMP